MQTQDKPEVLKKTSSEVAMERTEIQIPCKNFITIANENGIKFLLIPIANSNSKALGKAVLFEYNLGTLGSKTRWFEAHIKIPKVQIKPN